MIDAKALEAAAEAIAEQFCKDMDAPAQVFAGRAIAAYLAAERERGFVMVPVEPTEGMLDAVDDHDNYWGYCADGRPSGPADCYRAMIEASAKEGE